MNFFLLIHLSGEYVLHFGAVLETVAARQRSSGHLVLLSGDWTGLPLLLFITRKKPTTVTTASKKAMRADYALRLQGFWNFWIGLLLVWMETKYAGTPCKRPVQPWSPGCPAPRRTDTAAVLGSHCPGAATWKAKVPEPCRRPRKAAQQPEAGAVSPAAQQTCRRRWGSRGAALSFRFPVSSLAGSRAAWQRSWQRLIQLSKPVHFSLAFG